MRTYQNGTKDKKKLSKKMMYIILLSLSIVAIATIITLSLTLGGKPPVDNNPDDGLPSGGDPVTPKVVYTVPMDSFTVGMPASLTQIVYMSSMNNWRTHNGIDLIAEAGSKVYAITDGTVTNIQNKSLEATIITITHKNGVVSYYYGLSEDVMVEVGNTVKGGDVIGTVAASMPLESDVGAHLHLEIKENNKLVDPMKFLPELADK